MKSQLTLIALFICTSMAFAQTGDATNTTTEATESGAKIEFVSETIDYGTIAHNADGNREFQFTNTGNEPLIITNAKGSCGCTVPTWPKEPIAPGASDVIKVKYATNRVGAFKKTVTLSTNTGEAAKILTIKGTVLPDEAPAPAEDVSPE